MKDTRERFRTERIEALQSGRHSRWLTIREKAYVLTEDPSTFAVCAYWTGDVEHCVCPACFPEVYAMTSKRRKWHDFPE